MVYWHDGTGAATAGKHMSDVCSGRGQVKGSWRRGCWGRFEEDGGGLTLLGPGPPKTEGDEGHDDEDEGPEDNNHYEVGEVAGPRHAIFGVSRTVNWDVRWDGLIGTSWKDTVERCMRRAPFFPGPFSASGMPPHL